MIININPYIRYIAPEIAAAIVGGGLSLASTGASIGASANVNRKNRKWQEKMYGKSVENNREDATTAYERQRRLLAENAEIDLENQMKAKRRGWAADVEGLRAAGLNPMLALGAGGTQGVGGTGAPSVQPAHSAGFGNPYTSVPQMRGLETAGGIASQAALVQAEIRKKDAETREIEGETAPIRQSMDEQKARIEELNGKINLMLIQGGLYKSQESMNNIQSRWWETQASLAEATKTDMAQTVRWQLYKTAREYQLMGEQLKQAKKTTEYQMRMLELQISYVQANINQLNSQAGLNRNLNRKTNREIQVFELQMPTVAAMAYWKARNEMELKDRLEAYLDTQKRGQDKAFEAAMIKGGTDIGISLIDTFGKGLIGGKLGKYSRKYTTTKTFGPDGRFSGGKTQDTWIK